MKIVVPKLVFLVVITIATSCAANGVVEEGGSLLVNEDERAAIINTFLPPDREFELMGVTQKVSKGSKKTPILRYSKVTIQNDTDERTVGRYQQVWHVRVVFLGRDVVAGVLWDRLYSRRD